jgi:hypothetical protein
MKFCLQGWLSDSITSRTPSRPVPDGPVPTTIVAPAPSSTSAQPAPDTGKPSTTSHPSMTPRSGATGVSTPAFVGVYDLVDETGHITASGDEVLTINADGTYEQVFTYKTGRVSKNKKTWLTYRSIIGLAERKWYPDENCTISSELPIEYSERGIKIPLSADEPKYYLKRTPTAATSPPP